MRSTCHDSCRRARTRYLVCCWDDPDRVKYLYSYHRFALYIIQKMLQRGDGFEHFATDADSATDRLASLTLIAITFLYRDGLLRAIGDQGMEIEIRFCSFPRNRPARIYCSRDDSNDGQCT